MKTLLLHPREIPYTGFNYYDGFKDYPTVEVGRVFLDNFGINNGVLVGKKTIKNLDFAQEIFVFL